MSKSFSIVIIFSFICASLYAQVDTSAFRKPENYGIAVNYYHNLLNQHPQSNYYPYQMACYYSLQGKSDSALSMLNLAIDRGVLAGNILTDTDFESLYGSAGWSAVMERLKQQFLNKNKKITQPDLAIELWLMGIDDQRYRTLRKNYKKTESISVDGWKERVTRVEAIIDQYGWPKISMVGDDAAEAAFLIIQHSDKIKHYLPYIIKAANEGEANKTYAAMMIDRYLCTRTWGPFFLKPVQIYGTQFYREGKFDKKEGRMVLSKMNYYPIADPLNLDARRAYIGKGDFKSECNRFKVQFPGIETLDKSIKIKKRWIRKGYLLGYKKVEK